MASIKYLNTMMMMAILVISMSESSEGLSNGKPISPVLISGFLYRDMVCEGVKLMRQNQRVMQLLPLPVLRHDETGRACDWFPVVNYIIYDPSSKCAVALNGFGPDVSFLMGINASCEHYPEFRMFPTSCYPETGHASDIRIVVYRGVAYIRCVFGEYVVKDGVKYQCGILAQLKAEGEITFRGRVYLIGLEPKDLCVEKQEKERQQEVMLEEKIRVVAERTADVVAERKALEVSKLVQPSQWGVIMNSLLASIGVSAFIIIAKVVYDRYFKKAEVIQPQINNYLTANISSNVPHRRFNGVSSILEEIQGEQLARLEC